MFKKIFEVFCAANILFSVSCAQSYNVQDVLRFYNIPGYPFNYPTVVVRPNVSQSTPMSVLKSMFAWNHDQKNASTNSKFSVLFSALVHCAKWINRFYSKEEFLPMSNLLIESMYFETKRSYETLNCAFDSLVETFKENRISAPPLPQLEQQCQLSDKIGNVIKSTTQNISDTIVSVWFLSKNIQILLFMMRKPELKFLDFYNKYFNLNIRILDYYSGIDKICSLLEQTLNHSQNLNRYFRQFDQTLKVILQKHPPISRMTRPVISFGKLNLGKTEEKAIVRSKSVNLSEHNDEKFPLQLSEVVGNNEISRSFSSSKIDGYYCDNLDENEDPFV